MSELLAPQQIEDIGASVHREFESAMLRYEPVRGSHAIQEAVFYVQFAPEIDLAAIRYISAQSGDIAAVLPNKSDMQRIQFEAHEDGSQNISQAVAGIEFQLPGSDLPADWSMRFTSDGVSMHCMAYTRYDEVWPFARDLLLKAVALVPAGHAISAIGLRYIDRFRFNADAGEYDLKLLFRESNRYVTPRCFDAGPRWHCHNGWFARVRDAAQEMGIDQECLNQLNLSSGDEITPAGSNTFVTIDHNLIARPTQLGDFNISADRSGWLDQLMLALHKDNKRTTGQLLTDSVCRRLNLVPDERGQ